MALKLMLCGYWMIIIGYKSEKAQFEGLPRDDVLFEGHNGPDAVHLNGGGT